MADQEVPTTTSTSATTDAAAAPPPVADENTASAVAPAPTSAPAASARPTGAKKAGGKPAADSAAGGGGGGKRGKKQAKQDFLKTPKGTQDYGPVEMAVRERVFDIIRSTFRKYGAVAIETPVFELKETLTGKYGEDSKLIYDLADQGGESCALRYDLTVPFARYLAMNGLKNMKRYHIARVYRRDNPKMTKGRFREFYQCDIDIAGEYDLMVPDAEVFAAIVDCLTQLQVGKFMIKVNHRKLLDGILEICGVPEASFRPICSAIDKLDKSPWEEVRAEMVTQKGLPEEVADKIWTFAQRKGAPLVMLEELRTSGICGDNQSANTALAEMERLFSYLDAYGILDSFSFDLSLARGLDYYTGVIGEAVLTEGENLGSIAGGGRYDKLVGIFGSQDIPAIGFSLGIERIFSILQAKLGKQVRACSTEVFVASIDKNLLVERMKILKELRAVGIASEILAKENPRIKPQLSMAEEKGAAYAIIIGGREVEKGVVVLKSMTEREQLEVPRAELVSVLLARLRPNTAAAAVPAATIAAAPETPTS